MIILLFKNDETIYLSCHDARKGPNYLTFVRNVGVNHTVMGTVYLFLVLFMHEILFYFIFLK